MLEVGGPPALKCPECGFVSFPGLDRCKKCGHLLTHLPGEPKEIPPLFYLSHKPAKGPALQDSADGQPAAETAEHDIGALDIELKPGNLSHDIPENNRGQSHPPPPESNNGHDWKSELAERVQEYRQRRARLRNTDEGEENSLGLDFGVSPPEVDSPRPNVIEFPSAEELERAPKPTGGLWSAPRASGLEDFESGIKNQESEIDAGFAPKVASVDETAPLQIEMGSSRDNSLSGFGAGDLSSSGTARMGSRFFAGVLDALVLLSGAAIYALIFWRTGGQFSERPVELLVGGVIALIFIFLYFAGCTALSSATPGLIWAGLEVTTFEGTPPRLSECLWRAFGYAVSMCALMLGFIWAVVDADGLTWHDRISRTLIVPADHQ